MSKLGDELVQAMSGRITDIDPVTETPMASPQPNRTARLEARIAPDALAVVRRAAEIQGRSISDFVVAAAHDAANRAIEETHLIRLSIEDQTRFANLLLKPPALSPALKRARQAHTRLIAKAR